MGKDFLCGNVIAGMEIGQIAVGILPLLRGASVDFCVGGVCLYLCIVDLWE
jgi:hypothetical protein